MEKIRSVHLLYLPSLFAWTWQDTQFGFSLSSMEIIWRSFICLFFSFFFILDMVEHTEVYSLIFFNGDDMTISFGLYFMTFDDQLLDRLKQEDYHNGIHQIIVNLDHHSRMKWNYYWFYHTLIEITEHPIIHHVHSTNYQET